MLKVTSQFIHILHNMGVEMSHFNCSCWSEIYCTINVAMVVYDGDKPSSSFLIFGAGGKLRTMLRLGCYKHVTSFYVLVFYSGP